MPTIPHADQLKIAVTCFTGALISAALVPLALLLFATLPPLGAIPLAITAALTPVLLCTSLGFLTRWALLARHTPDRRSDTIPPTPAHTTMIRENDASGVPQNKHTQGR